MRRYEATVLLDAEWFRRPVPAPQGRSVLPEFEIIAR